MKIGMKKEMGVADEMTSSILGSHLGYLRMKPTDQFVFTIFGEKLQLELLEDHKYWHVGEVECC